MKYARPIFLTPEEKRHLESLASSHHTNSKPVYRGRIILLAAKGFSNTAIATTLGISRQTVGKWRTRFSEQGLTGLEENMAGRGRPRLFDDDKRNEIVQLTHEPPEDAAYWTAKSMAKIVGASASTVQRAWRERGLNPREMIAPISTRYAYFPKKVIQIAGVYLQPPFMALALSAETQTRSTNKSQLSHSSETFFRDLKKASSEELAGKHATCPDEEFVKFLNGLGQHFCEDEIHLFVYDPASIVEDYLVQDCLAQNARYIIHALPYRDSWMAQVYTFSSMLAMEPPVWEGAGDTPSMREAIERFIDGWESRARSMSNPPSFSWIKGLASSSQKVLTVGGKKKGTVQENDSRKP